MKLTVKKLLSNLEYSLSASSDASLPEYTVDRICRDSRVADNGSVFFVLAGFTVIYFITAAFFLPETKGRTLEEVEQYFTTGKMPGKKEEEDEAKA